MEPVPGTRPDKNSSRELDAPKLVTPKLVPVTRPTETRPRNPSWKLVPGTLVTKTFVLPKLVTLELVRSKRSDSARPMNSSELLALPAGLLARRVAGCMAGRPDQPVRHSAVVAARLEVGRSRPQDDKFRYQAPHTRPQQFRMIRSC